MKQSHPFALTILLVLNLLLGACQPSIRPLPQTRHSETQWKVTASLPLDALAFLNALTGDPLVGAHYTGEVSHFKSKFSQAEEQAASRLAEFRQKTLGANLSGFLCAWFLAGKPETLDDMINLADHPKVLRQALIDYDASLVEMNVYYNDAAWKNFQLAAPDVKTGHHLIGTHFVTIPDDTGVLRSTVHELLHNPFNNTDSAFWKAADALKNNPDIWGAFDRRNPVYGYNDWPYYVAEDSVRALEQLIEVKLGLGERWNWSEDGGMHQLAAIVYERMKQENFPQDEESYQAFLIRMVREGKLSAGR